MGSSRTADLLARALLAAGTASVLFGCASSSVNLAPPRPDRPWAPKTTGEGEIRPSKGEGPAGARSYVLPANERLPELTTPPSVDSTHPYSLPELIDIAQSQNPLTQVAWNAARDAALAVGIARSTYLPKLTATVVGGFQGTTGSQTQSATGVPIVGSVSGNGSNRNSASGAISSVGLQWLLFDFGERGALVDAAKQLSVASNVTFTAAHQQVAYAVTINFYAHAAAVQRVAMVEKALANAKEVEAAAALRLQQGQGTAVDLAQARQATAQAEMRLVQATGSAQSSYYELLGAMGISPRTRLRIADVSGRPMLPDSIELTERAIDEAIARRPDVLAAYATAKAAEAGAHATSAAFLPKLFVAGNVAYSVGELSLTTIPAVGQLGEPTVNLSGTQFSGVVIGGISVPIYDGGVRSATHEQAKNRVASANATLRQTREQSVRQIVVADSALRTSLALFASASAVVDAADTTFNAALESYRSGVGSITVATIAESGLLDARIAKTDAYSAAQIAAATLAFATGAITTAR
jgi:outer membrane protein TolC